MLKNIHYFTIIIIKLDENPKNRKQFVDLVFISGSESLFLFTLLKHLPLLQASAIIEAENEGYLLLSVFGFSYIWAKWPKLSTIKRLQKILKKEMRRSRYKKGKVPVARRRGTFSSTSFRRRTEKWNTYSLERFAHSSCYFASIQFREHS